MSSVSKLYHEWAEQLTMLFGWKRPERRKVLGLVNAGNLGARMYVWSVWECICRVKPIQLPPLTNEHGRN